MAMSSSRARVLAGFRRLNRARIALFQGDEVAMKVTRQELRAAFAQHKTSPSSGPMFEELVAGIDEATDMLRHEVVRGDLNPTTGRYGASCNSCVVCVGCGRLVSNNGISDFRKFLIGEGFPKLRMDRMK